MRHCGCWGKNWANPPLPPAPLPQTLPYGAMVGPRYAIWHGTGRDSEIPFGLSMFRVHAGDLNLAWQTHLGAHLGPNDVLGHV